MNTRFNTLHLAQQMTPPSHSSGSGIPGWMSVLVGTCVVAGIIILAIRRR